jgi:hypothetical protein
VDALDRLRTDALSGDGAAALGFGEAGIGKTTLAESVAQRAAPDENRGAVACAPRRRTCSTRGDLARS